jgi:SOS-response transcriptional repressor LexA
MEKSPSWLELESVYPLTSKTAKGKPIDDGKPTVETITSLSPDTIKRKYPEYVVKLSDRREGMKLRNALKIAAGK